MLDKSKIEEKLEAISQVLISEETKDISLMDGLPGIILYLNNYASLTKSQFIKDECEIKLDILLDQINDPSCQISQTYCDGLTGILSFFQVLGLTNHEYFDIVDNSYDDIVLSSIVNDIEAAEYDFLHGAMGGLNYLLLKYPYIKSREEKNRFTNVIKHSIEFLDKISIKDGDYTSWKFPVKEDFIVNPDVVNIGMAHGIASIIAILSEVYKCQIERTLSKDLLGKSFLFLRKIKSVDPDSYSQFPTYYKVGGSNSYDSRLAWCYGDLSIGLSIIKMGNALNSRVLINEGIFVCQNTVSRQTMRQSGVYDCGFCHGTTGNAYLYGILFEQTKIAQFKIAQNYWLGKTLDYGAYDEGYAGFRTFVTDGIWSKDLGLLKGVSGIGLVLLSLENDNVEWSKLLQAYL